MIERNLGNAERLVRLLFGLALGIWLLSRPDINGMEVFIAVIAVMLILNGVFSRCYLWFVLDIDTTARTRTSADCESA
ncbi:MAG: DUF2892 domain-containing protein [Halioglobus sp.]|nr:DUF2892 domain-containing protein [Halioglobus sp.]